MNAFSMSIEDNLFLSPEASSITFIVTSLSGPTIGPVDNAIIFVDDINKGNTDANGILNTTIESIPGGTPHGYSVIKEGFNESIGSLLTFPGNNIEPVIMGNLTPGKGSISVWITCQDKPCSDTYIVIQGIVRGLTSSNGSLFIEGLDTVTESLIAFKAGFGVGSTSITVQNAKTIKIPPFSLVPLDPKLGYIGFIVYDTSGSLLDGVNIVIDEDALTPTIRGITYFDRSTRGDKHTYTITKSGYDTVTGEFVHDFLVLVFIVVMYKKDTTPIDKNTLQKQTGSVILMPEDVDGKILDVVDIYIDGLFLSSSVFVAKTTYINLSSGIHTYIARKQGYNDSIGRISIISNEEQDITITMTKSESSLDTGGKYMNKILSLDEMRNMPLESVVQLYREGYKLEDSPKIETAQISGNFAISDTAILIIGAVAVIGVYLATRR